MHPTRLPRALALCAFALTLGGCSIFHRPRLDPVPAVPDASRRLQVRTSEPGWAASLEASAACLVHTGSTEGCAGTGTRADACDVRQESVIAAELHPAIEAVSRVTMRSSFSIAEDFRTLLPGALVTRAVYDARRQQPCTLWGGDGTVLRCAAVRAGDVWLLFSRTSAGPGPVEEVDVFLARGPCRTDVRP